MKKSRFLKLNSFIMIICIVSMLSKLHANDTMVKVNGQIVKFDHPLQSIRGIELAPLQPIIYLLNGSYNWDENKQTTKIVYQNTEVLLDINNLNLIVSKGTIIKEDFIITLPIPPRINNDTGFPIYPIMAILEVLELEVIWNSRTSIIDINSSPMQSFGNETFPKEFDPTTTEVIGFWTGFLRQYSGTISIPNNLSWSVNIPAVGLSDGGSYTRSGNSASFYSNNLKGILVGTAKLIEENTMDVVLNRNAFVTGTFQLIRQ